MCFKINSIGKSKADRKMSFGTARGEANNSYRFFRNCIFIMIMLVCQNVWTIEILMDKDSKFIAGGEIKFTRNIESGEVLGLKVASLNKYMKEAGLSVGDLIVGIHHHHIRNGPADLLLGYRVMEAQPRFDIRYKNGGHNPEVSLSIHLIYAEEKVDDSDSENN